VSTQPKIDVAALLPPKRRIVRDVVVIALLSVVCGPLLGLYVFGEVRGATLTLSLSTGLGWGLSFAFVAAFIYTAWLIRGAWQAYHKHVAALKMDEFYRAVEGEPKD
jgi:ABC-type thiamin/hydroxymethylpyrimidine transport system permease subunit